MPRRFLLSLVCLCAEAQTLITGTAVPEMTTFDTAIPALLEKWKVPGAALAISDGGRLIYARGFGYADVENKVPVEPFSLFRIASISKTITSVTIMKLVEEGRLDLNARIGTPLCRQKPMMLQIQELPPCRG